VVLFDEPLSNLDAKLRAEMRLELRELQRQLGITSVYVAKLMTPLQRQIEDIKDALASIEENGECRVGEALQAVCGPVPFRQDQHIFGRQRVDGFGELGLFRMSLPLAFSR
jgi:ABC-type molybdate transport system ATPase subunit